MEEQQRQQERASQREREERRRYNPPQVPRGNPFENFVTTETHSPEGDATGMLSVQHLQRIQSRPENSKPRTDDPTECYDANYAAHYVHNLGGHYDNFGGRVYEDEQTLPKRPIDDHEPARLQIDREKKYAVSATPTTRRRPVNDDDTCISQEQPQFEHTDEVSASNDYSERYVYGAEVESKAYLDPDYVPLEERPAPPIPHNNINDEQSEYETESEFTRTNDPHSDEDDSQATVLDKSTVFRGTWADNDGPQIHRSEPKLEDDLICESNIMYESTDVDDSESNSQVLQKLNIKGDKDSYGNIGRIKLPETEALDQLDKVVEDHMDPVGISPITNILSPITILPPLNKHKLPPLNVNNLPPIEIGRAMTLPDPVLYEEVKNDTKPRSRRQRSSSISEDVQRLHRQRRHSVSEEGARQERKFRPRNRTSSQSRDPREFSDNEGLSLRKNSRMSKLDAEKEMISHGRVRDVPNSPARERKSRSRQKNSTDAVRRSHSESRIQVSHSERIEPSTPLQRRRRDSVSRRDYNCESDSDSRHTKDSSRSRHGSGRLSDAVRTRPDPGKDSDTRRFESGHVRDSSRSRPASGKESNRSRHDVGKESNRTRPESAHARDSSRSRSESGKESTRSRPDSAKEYARSRPDSGKESTRSRPDSGKESTRSRPDQQKHGHQHRMRSYSTERTLSGYESSEKDYCNTDKHGAGDDFDIGDGNDNTKKDVHIRNRSHHKEPNGHTVDDIKKHSRGDVQDHSKDKNRNDTNKEHNLQQLERNGDSNHRERKHREGHHRDNNKHKHRSKQDQTDEFALTLHAEDELYQMHKKAPSLESTLENGFDTLSDTMKSNRLNDSLSGKKKDKTQNHKQRSLESSGPTGYTNTAMESDDIFDV